MTWFDALLYNMTFRRAWSAGCVLMLVAGLYIDRSMHETVPDLASFHSLREVWLTVAFGFAIGLAGAAWERRALQRRTDELLAFHSLPWRERRQWRHQRENLRRIWWLLALMLLLLVWCAVRMIFCWPAVAAIGIPMGLFNARYVREFGAKLRAQGVRRQGAISPREL